MPFSFRITGHRNDKMAQKRDKLQYGCDEMGQKSDEMGYYLLVLIQNRMEKKHHWIEK